MFVSVKEAVGITGKSQTTISRLCSKKIHTKYVKKENNKYFINKEFLLAKYPQHTKKETEKEIETKRNTEKEIINKPFIRTAINTPQKSEIFKFEDEPSEFGEKIIDDISVKITKRFNQTNNQKDTSINNQVIPWESIIGVSIGVLLIVGFILFLYLEAK